MAAAARGLAACLASVARTASRGAPRVAAWAAPVAWVVSAPLATAAAGAARARMAAPATSAPPTVTRTRSTVARAGGHGARSRMGAPQRRAGRRQVQMFSLAVRGAKLEAGCGVVRGPALAVLP